MNNIELNLFAYIDKIQRGSLLNLHDEKVKAEDFFLRIFKKVYGFEELVNLNYEKLNSKGIDLYDSGEKIGIQITAIQSNEKNKINDTKKLTLKNWKSKGLKKLWVFFIIETKYLKDIDTSIVEEVEGVEIHIKTIKNLIGDISKLNKEKGLKSLN